MTVLLKVVGAPPAPAPLLERAHELDVLADGVAGLAAGRSAVVVLDAPAGLGKTALLDQAAELAARAGHRVRHAAPGPLERHFSFGVIRTLLETPLRAASAGERARALEGVAATAGELLLEGSTPGADSTTLVAHSVLWLCSALAERRPLALFVDDAHWADRRSLAVLAYLAGRSEDLPLLLVVAARGEDPDGATDLLSLLGAARSTTVLRPQPLTEAGAVALIERLAPGTPDEVAADCGRVVAGNPWLLGELGRLLAERGPSAVCSASFDGSPRTGVVRRRMAELSPRDRRVLEALAVAGDTAAAHVVAAVARVGIGELSPARDALVAAGLLVRDLSAYGADRFAHCLIASAVVSSLSRGERERAHRAAARGLLATGADDELVAGHLLESGPNADPAVSASLSRAASAAAERGEPHAAAAYLERALQERASGDHRGRMLAQLGAVTFDAGLPEARTHLREALREVLDGPDRVDVLTRLAMLNLVDARDEDLTRLFERELADERDPDVRLAVETAALDALMILPARQAERARRVAAIAGTTTADPLLERVVKAHRAWVGIEQATPHAPACAALARRALDGGLLLAEANRRSAYVIATRALALTDDAAAEGAIDALREEATTRRSLRLRTAAAWFAGELALRTGRVADAENHARLGLDLAPGQELDIFSGGAAVVLVGALAERGAFADAHEFLREHRLDLDLGPALWEVGMRHARARLALLEGDFERAHAGALAAGELRERQRRSNPTLAPWRSTAALALAHLGRRDEAAVLADEELERARHFGARLPIARAVYARAVAEPDHAARTALCTEGLTFAHGAEAVALRLELGSAQASLGARREARETLRPALADADAAGAVLLAQRARRELVATGLRPRQAAMEGAAALTPRQRQICELASAGKGNRAIAQELFLSVKTVETHLAAGFRKLGVNARTELAHGLAA